MTWPLRIRVFIVFIFSERCLRKLFSPFWVEDVFCIPLNVPVRHTRNSLPSGKSRRLFGLLPTPRFDACSALHVLLRFRWLLFHPQFPQRAAEARRVLITA